MEWQVSTHFRMSSCPIACKTRRSAPVEKYFSSALAKTRTRTLESCRNASSAAGISPSIFQSIALRGGRWYSIQATRPSTLVFRNS